MGRRGVGVLRPPTIEDSCEERDLLFQEPENYLMLMFMCRDVLFFGKEEVGGCRYLFNADSSDGRYKWNESTDFLSRAGF